MKISARLCGLPLVLLVAMTALAACVATPVPAWRVETRYAVEQATQATLTGRFRAAEQHWRVAADAAAASGRADILARIALARCAAEQAALVWDGCPSAQPYLHDAGLQERAYAAYLGALQDDPVADGGNPWIEALPPAHQPIARMLSANAAHGDILRALNAIEDPLARLVAGGVVWRAGRLTPQGVALMVETASQQGWRRPLAAWLGVQARMAEASGDADAAARARRRLDWVLGSSGTGRVRADTR